MEQQKERKIYLWLLGILCLISLGLSLWVFKLTSNSAVHPVPPRNSLVLDARPIIPQNMVIKSSYVGFAEAINQVQIIPYINGYLQNIFVRPGQFVEEGAPLLSLNPDEYKAQFNAAQAALLQKEASLSYNKNYYDRVQKSGKNAFSDNERDNAKNNYQQSLAAVENAKAALELAKINLGYTFIRAPISGFVGNFSLSPGDYVAPNGEALLDIVQTNPIRVVFSLTDKNYLDQMDSQTSLFKNSVIRLKLANGKYFKNEGIFKYTDNKLDKSTNSLAIYVYFKNDNNELLPNSFVTVEISQTFKNTVIIEKSLIKMGKDGNYLAIVRHNTPLNEKVEIIAEEDNKYILKNTFEPGDLLLLTPFKGNIGNTDLHFNIIR